MCLWKLVITPLVDDCLSIQVDAQLIQASLEQNQKADMIIRG